MIGKIKEKHLLLIILSLTAFLNLYGLARGDPINDEVLIGFRALGLIDFDEAPHQTTPLEWFDPAPISDCITRINTQKEISDKSKIGFPPHCLENPVIKHLSEIGAGFDASGIPWWTHLSFHDHPPLAFWAEHISLAAFGENNWGLRFPSALLGIASVYLLYLFIRRLSSPQAGLLAAALYGLTVNHIYISRTGMQEAYVIFFILLACYFFLRALENDNYFLWTGMALGLGFLTKYTVAFLVPAFLLYLLFFNRSAFTNKKLWLGAGIALLIFSPVIIYNVMLWRATGHFDFQFSFIFRQNPEVWKAAPGKDIGSWGYRIKEFVPRMIATNSWLFLLLFFGSVAAFLFALIRNPREIVKRYVFLVCAFVFLALLILAIGPSYRFLAMLTPFIAGASGIFLAYIFEICAQKNKIAQKITFGLFIVFLAFEIFYTWNNQIAYFPRGPEPWLSSRVRTENANLGYNELMRFFDREFEGKMPALSFAMRYQFLQKLQDRVLAAAEEEGKEPYPGLVVTSGEYNQIAKLWVLDRLQIYHGWPIVDADTYRAERKTNGNDFYQKLGFRHFYFVLSGGKPLPSLLTAGLKTIAVAAIPNGRGEEAFRVYTYASPSSAE
ncbi:MAG: hypothetical protein G01um101433_697 [Parcubacteria group bacterium Gr01-1014_33]|nr:MAG: hypothetical protein G01um101433_697 [Parcubacteria group bacterium Gr01-1014_33]